MGNSGTVDLRELAMLGFGRYVVEPDPAAQHNAGAAATIINLALGTAADAGQSRPFKLIGYLYVQDTPPDALKYILTDGPSAVPLATSQPKGTRIERAREPLFVVLTPEKPQLTIATYWATVWAQTWMGGASYMYVDTLVGSQEGQLNQLYDYLAMRQQPVSFIEGAIGGLVNDVTQFIEGGRDW